MFIGSLQLLVLKLHIDYFCQMNVELWENHVILMLSVSKLMGCMSALAKLVTLEMEGHVQVQPL